ncbi:MULTISPECIES: diguanylate cyclase domain-containing protein [unclassified Sulfuricurvum]|uniref:diguanylate cyclase domain-containing protein n=1 Tax=unclassified Sulfuricurvum TaxID=2632390 RepID=UPI0025F71550|nr:MULTISPECIES: diguanylate cyclase [unclassified Sulfuricurvum]
MPFALLALGTLLSLMAFWFGNEHLKEKERLRFETVTKQATLLVKTRMDAYRQTLYAGAGLYDASANVENDEWLAFTNALRINQNFPGIQGFGFTRVVDSDGKLGLRTAIVYLEPLDERNLRAIGYDMYSEKVRREAMTRAVVTGRAAASGKVRLIQENTIDEQAGFLIYVPVYRKGMALETKAQRMAAIRGFVYAPFRINDLMRAVFGDHYDDLAFEIYDGDTTEPNLLLSRNFSAAGAHAMMVEKRIDVGGRTWTLRFKPLHGFTKEAETSFPWLVLLLGMLLTFAIFEVVRSLLRTKEQAQRLAEKMTEKLSASEEWLRFALEGTGDGIWDWNVVTNKVFFSKRWKEMLGFSEDEIKGSLKEWEERVHPDDIAKVLRDVQDHLDGKTEMYTNEHRVRCKDGTYKWIFDRGVVAERDKHNRPIRMVGSHTDISEPKRIEAELMVAKERAEAANTALKLKSEELEKLSMHDGLTRIPNRRYFDEIYEKRYKEALRDAKPLAIIMVDVDHFKNFNDHYGHAQGDECLIKIADALQKTLKRPSDFVARYGGEEFVVLLADIDEEGMKTVAEHLVDSVRKLNIPHAFSSAAPYVTISAGAAFSHTPAEKKKELLKHADEAMYRSKENGRDRYTCYA